MHTIVRAVHKIQFWKPKWRYENWIELIFEFNAGSSRRKAFKTIKKGSQQVGVNRCCLRIIKREHRDKKDICKRKQQSIPKQRHPLVKMNCIYEEFKERHSVWVPKEHTLKHSPTAVFPMTRGALGYLAFSSRRSFRVTGVIQVVLSPWNVSLLLLGSSAILCREAKPTDFQVRLLGYRPWVYTGHGCPNGPLAILVFWWDLTSREQERVALFETRFVSFVWAPSH